MSRAQRLLDLLQLLRRHRRPVSAAALADELGISVRTLYRDIALLQAQGADIAGAPGIGYQLRPGFLLPPLMFSEEEIEALVLGSRWVARHADKPLAAAAANALAKVAAVLPADLRHDLDTSTILVVPGELVTAGDQSITRLRQAIRREQKLDIVYRDVQERETRRRIWPFALAFFERVRIVLAWCETRQAFRHFRTDRIVAIDHAGERYPRRRQALLKEWRLAEGMPEG